MVSIDSKNLQKKYFTTAISAALFSFFFLLIPAVFLVNYQIDRDRNAILEETVYRANALVAKIEGKIDANIAVGRGFEAHISALGELSANELAALGKHLIDPNLNIRHIGIAPNLVITDVYPRKGNEAAIGLDYRKNLRQKNAVIRAVESGQIVLAGPLTLVQGGDTKHLIARIPVKQLDGTVWGLVAAVINADSLFADAGFFDLTEKYTVAIRGKDGLGAAGKTFIGKAALFDEAVRTFRIEIPGGEWQLGIIPIEGWSPKLGTCLIYWFAALGFCFLTSIAVYALRKQIIERSQHLQNLEELASIDPLTGLTSRYQLIKYLNELIEECKRNKQKFSVLFIDLDHFKHVNDSLGHAMGDKLLIEIAEKLRTKIRPYDILSRLGGDEFIVVLKGMTDIKDIETQVSRISQSFNEGLIIAGIDLTITGSIGVSIYPEDGKTTELLIQHADRAMYEGKRSGRNTLYFYNTSMGNEAGRYVELTSAIKQGLSRSEFQVHYQPIYNIKLQQYTHCEALCRWYHASKGPISPDEFIPVAEQSGLICDLGLWISNEVFQCQQEMQRAGFSLGFAINRSPQEFRSTLYTKQLLANMENLKTPPNSITFEITESLLMSSNHLAEENFLLLKGSGVNFSIDDFGTGYSAINYLRKYPVKTLKIDRSFVAELGESSQAETLVKVILQMAKTLEISVVAEGVETKKQFSFLASMGCDYIQGYYMAKPMDKAAFKQFIFEHNQRVSS